MTHENIVNNKHSFRLQFSFTLQSHAAVVIDLTSILQPCHAKQTQQLQL